MNLTCKGGGKEIEMEVRNVNNKNSFNITVNEDDTIARVKEIIYD